MNAEELMNMARRARVGKLIIPEPVEDDPGNIPVPVRGKRRSVYQKAIADFLESGAMSWRYDFPGAREASTAVQSFKLWAKDAGITVKRRGQSIWLVRA